MLCYRVLPIGSLASLHDASLQRRFTLCSAHLFVGKHEDWHCRQVLVLQQAAELALRDRHAATVCAVHHLPSPGEPQSACVTC